VLIGLPRHLKAPKNVASYKYKLVHAIRSIHDMRRYLKIEFALRISELH